MTHSELLEAQPDALIFDMDGTLMDNMPCHAACWVALLNDHGKPITLKEYWRQEPGGTAEEVARGFLGADLPNDQVACLVQQKEFLYRYLFRKKVKPLRRVRRLLAQAKDAGIPLALASAAGKRNIDFSLPALGLPETFDVVVGANDVERGKPEPDLFLLAAARLGVRPERCLVFEDSSAGLEAARRAGMPAIGIATTHPVARLRREPGVIEAMKDYSDLTLRRVRELWMSR